MNGSISLMMCLSFLAFLSFNFPLFPIMITWSIPNLFLISLFPPFLDFSDDCSANKPGDVQEYYRNYKEQASDEVCLQRHKSLQEHCPDKHWLAQEGWHSRDILQLSHWRWVWNHQSSCWLPDIPWQILFQSWWYRYFPAWGINRRSPCSYRAVILLL